MRYKSEKEWLESPERAKVISELCEKIPGFKKLMDKKDSDIKKRCSVKHKSFLDIN